MPAYAEYLRLRFTDVDVRGRRSTHRFDSGYTNDDIQRILDDLIDAPTQATFGGDAGRMISYALGLDGNEWECSPTGTVMLDEPCSVVDARLDAICALISRGLSLVDALGELPPQLRRRTDA